MFYEPFSLAVAQNTLAETFANELLRKIHKFDEDEHFSRHKVSIDDAFESVLVIC